VRTGRPAIQHVPLFFIPQFAMRLLRNSRGWCGVNWEFAGLSTAVLAPRPGVPQRKSLNSSEKMVSNLCPRILCQKALESQRAQSTACREFRSRALTTDGARYWSPPGYLAGHRTLDFHTCEPITRPTMKGVMRRNRTCHRHHTDQSCGNPEASTPPSSPVDSPGRGEGLMQ
jgi:hypothetical protein